MGLQDDEANDAPVTDMDSAAAAFDEYFADQDAEEPKEDEVGDEEDDVDTDLDLSEDDDEQGEGDEPAKPAIDPPAAWSQEAKDRFARLPVEDQKFFSELEAHRARQVTERTTKAAEAQRDAESRAARADAEARAVYANQLKAFADSMMPQMPDPRLAQHDPASYIALKAQYDADIAQHMQFVQQVESMGQQADAALSDAEVEARERELMGVPEYQNPDTRNEFVKRCAETAQVIGLDMSKIQHATAQEFKALRQISDWKEDADKYRAAMARQMQRVRQGKKQVSARPGPGVSDQGKGARDAKLRAKQSGDVKDAAKALAKLGF